MSLEIHLEYARVMAPIPVKCQLVNVSVSLSVCLTLCACLSKILVILCCVYLPDNCWKECPEFGLSHGALNFDKRPKTGQTCLLLVTCDKGYQLNGANALYCDTVQRKWIDSSNGSRRFEGPSCIH